MASGASISTFQGLKISTKDRASGRYFNGTRHCIQYGFVVGLARAVIATTLADRGAFRALKARA
jgi:hypothetical protein